MPEILIVVVEPRLGTFWAVRPGSPSVNVSHALALRQRNTFTPLPLEPTFSIVYAPADSPGHLMLAV
jgi:hypothetical protein